MRTGHLAALVLLLGLTGCSAPAAVSAPADPLPTSPPATASPSPSAPASSLAAPSATPTHSAAAVVAAADGSAAAALATLAVKGRAPKTGYDRGLFGQAWADVDRNGCDTRNDILQRDLTDETFRPGTRDCVVITGTLADPYSGQTLTFTKEDASAVQIDHVVALSDAWQKGAQQWEPSRRLAFANDPLNLLAVDGPTNSSKSDGDAATWLPPNRGYRCSMVARQVAVKQAYGLWVTAAESDAIASVLASCPDEPLPTSSSAPPPAAAPPATVPPPPVGPAPAAPADGQDPDYGSCKQAQANGAGPYVQGQDPEYAWYRDGDNDGVVCE